VIGDLFFELSIAYLGAWFFNLLVIELPRRKQRADAFEAINYRLRYLTRTGYALRLQLSICATDGDWNEQDALDPTYRELILAGMRSNR